MRFLVAVLAAFGLVALPMGGTALAETPPPPEPFANAAPADTDAAPDGDVAMDKDEQTAVNAVNGFWTRHFSQYFHGKTYHSPKVIGAYDSVADGPSCGGQPAQANNAFYCHPGDYLAWDQSLMRSGYQQIGNAWVYLIIAHEWGHAIQDRAGKRRVSQADELQADCFAGAALTGAVHDGGLNYSPNDGQRLGQSLAAAADKTPWTSSKDHGNAQQRIGAYNLGVNGGVPACISKKNFPFGTSS